MLLFPILPDPYGSDLGFGSEQKTVISKLKKVLNIFLQKDLFFCLKFLTFLRKFYFVVSFEVKVFKKHFVCKL